MELGLAGRRAIVTGASKGIGLAIAAELLSEGASVAICARNATKLADTAAVLAIDAPGSVFAQVCDVTIPSDVENFITAAADRFGGVIDILVNNAGGANPGGFEALTDGDWYGDYDTKLMSHVRCIRAALPYLRRSPTARVININAVAGRCPDPIFLATSANRAACLALSKALSIELGPEGILVNSVNMGYIDTPQWVEGHRRRSPDRPIEEFYAQLAIEYVPLGRFGKAEEVSGIVAFLASDRAGYITGASIDVAGGMGKYL
ncbi:SDR family oxidoreductase [Streptomyces lavendulocolor]|uniref:SDR family oxidoreductase n=1 Tax=Streptomyces lavendulocolor TaxID=67316 RepID=UPI00340737E4